MPGMVVAFALGAFGVGFLAALGFMSLATPSTHDGPCAVSCFVPIALAIEALGDLALWHVPPQFVESVSDIDAMVEKSVCVLGRAEGDDYRYRWRLWVLWLS